MISKQDENEWLAAIGQVVVNAAVLEWQIALFVALLEGQGHERARELAGTTGAAMRELKKQSNASPVLEPLYRDAKAVLDDRGILAHSIATVGAGQNGDESFFIWHPRSGNEAEVTPAKLREHAQDIRIATNRVLSAPPHATPGQQAGNT